MQVHRYKTHWLSVKKTFKKQNTLIYKLSLLALLMLYNKLKYETLSLFNYVKCNMLDNNKWSNAIANKVHCVSILWSKSAKLREEK